MLRRACCWAITLVAAFSLISRSHAGAPPSTKPDPQSVAKTVDASIGREVFAKSDAKLTPRCDDATYLRRTWLDVVGDIPTPEHVTAFLLDRSPDKRAQLVRNLLADPQYGLNWARYWRDVIMFRRIEDRAQIAANALEADLSRKLNDGAPWDKIAVEFITAEGDVRENGATALIMAQDARTEETTAEVARIFLGVQIQCAQCHDHRTDRWTRQQFHELAAFFPRIGVRQVRSATQRSFEVFANDRGGPRPNNDNNRPVPEHFMPDLENPSAPGTRMQPKFFLTDAALPYGTSDAVRRETLGKWLTENEWFAKALVNRMWAELVGEGFYEPIDDLGPDRTASAPETIALLSEYFRQSGYDLKWLLETICATEAYQRESRPRRDAGEGAPFAATVPQPLRADVLYNAVLSALDMNDASGRNARRQGGGGGGLRANRGPRGTFCDIFGYDPSDQRDAISGSIPQVLAMMNSAQVAGAVNAGRGGIVDRMLKEIRDNDQLVGEMYLQTLGREPTNGELAIAGAYIDEIGSRTEAVEDLMWALLNSAEFGHRR